MDPTTAKELTAILIQGGFVVVSIVLSYVVYKLWEKDVQSQKDQAVRVDGMQKELSHALKEKDDAVAKLLKDKDEAVAKLLKEKDETIARLQKEKDALYEQVIASNKAGLEDQVELTRKIVEELTKMRMAIHQLTNKAGRSLPPSPLENGD